VDGTAVDLRPASLAGVVLLISLGAALFSTLSLAIACIARTRERFMGIGQVLTMPIFFGSNAIYPLALMPDWLRIVALGNPLTYVVDGLRALMIKGAVSEFGLVLDIIVLLATTAAAVAVAARLYPRMGR
jgi:ABC-2 type transport system permease protein